MGLRLLEILKKIQCGDSPYTSDSDIYRRQNLTCKVDPHTERVNVGPLSAVAMDEGLWVPHIRFHRLFFWLCHHLVSVPPRSLETGIGYHPAVKRIPQRQSTCNAHTVNIMLIPTHITWR